ncbi:MAG: AAA family ATPase [Aureispira sp.]
MRITRIRIKNYSVFQAITSPSLGGLNVFTGPNGSGKSTFLDVLDFLHDAMVTNVAAAVQKRGGLSRLRTRKEEAEDIEIELHMAVKQETSSSYDELIYLLKIGEEDNQILVKQELLKQYSQLMNSDKVLLEVTDGLGKVANKKDGLIETILFELQERDKLCIGIVGEVRGYPAVNLLRELITNWQLVDFKKDKVLDSSQLAIWSKMLQEQQPATFEALVQKMQTVIPALETITVVETIDGRLVLQFKEGAFTAPFTMAYIGEGHLKFWAYLLLLHLPNPAPVMGIEAPENNLHHSLLEMLVDEFRAYTQRGGQLLMTSYAPSLIDNLRLEELFRMSKEKGQSHIEAAKDDLVVQKGYEIGESLGRLWN